MSEVQIKFQQDAPESKPVKTYTGSVSEWPKGVYRSSNQRHLLVKSASDSEGAAYFFSGRVSCIYSVTCEYIRVSDNPCIDSMTFAGSMNYPDGKPEGGQA
jgi:predicted AAA+ superfamily ATPase